MSLARARVSRVLRHLGTGAATTSASRSRAMAAAAGDSLTDIDQGVAVHDFGFAKRVTLSRPKALNALDMGMCKQLTPLYKQWTADAHSGSGLVVMKGEGDRAFCAGGDIRAIYDAKLAGKDVHTMTEFFRTEYELDQLIGNLPSTFPHIAILNGITMGGGVGLSVHGSVRVATDDTMFAMPETGIGFFCDVGGSFFLPRLPGFLGTFLALTGHRLKGADVLHAGVATHFVPKAGLQELEERLLAATSVQEANAVLDRMSSPAAELDNGLAGLADGVQRCFGFDTLEEIYAALAQETTEWGAKTLATLERQSPTSLRVVLQQMRLGAQLGFEECFEMEEKMAEEFMRRGDFFEGVRAQLVDKDRSPKWQPPTVEQVSPEDVARYFPGHM